MRYLSPLRYPGGKSKLANYLKLIINMNLLYDGDYIEPYVGGASVGLDLLTREYVRRIYINDIDFTIYAFWKSLLCNPDLMCKKIHDVKINIDEWKKQKGIYNNFVFYDEFQVGFATFFLNRTNRSGILTGGVIGGYGQNDKWCIDARFNRDELIKRIKLIASYAERIKLFNLDALTFLKKITPKLNNKALYYLDPPYYKKGKDLYLNYYEDKDHLEIATFLKNDFNQKYWILTYDNVIEIKELYSDFRVIQYNINYSANTYSLGEEIMVFSEKVNIPDNLCPSDNKRIKNVLIEKTYY